MSYKDSFIIHRIFFYIFSADLSGFLGSFLIYQDFIRDFTANSILKTTHKDTRKKFYGGKNSLPVYIFLHSYFWEGIRVMGVKF